MARAGGLLEMAGAVADGELEIMMMSGWLVGTAAVAGAVDQLLEQLLHLILVILLFIA